MLNEFRETSLEDADALASLHSLSQAYCPLAVFFATTQSLTSHHLRAFLSRGQERQDAFLYAPGSRNYHHAYPGGLLQHLLEFANHSVTMLAP
ncbi:TraI domain-containing protein [Vreelandella titanicae]|uniref:TraI domain-containing protein n=1 Tax=Vreelandella titanicae TaxID=664683 RepID=UPI001372E464|nr:TraI domain-containing protein [Halomonas titanicae]NAO98912.1 hypothetical protein [Halomonas sp. MG34]NVE93061.1 hypothetical protein [Halomonas titanicae]